MVFIKTTYSFEIVFSPFFLSSSFFESSSGGRCFYQFSPKKSFFILNL